jgi:hypothetical protein
VECTHYINNVISRPKTNAVDNIGPTKILKYLNENIKTFFSVDFAGCENDKDKIFQWGQIISSSNLCAQTGSGTHPVQWVPGPFPRG